MSYNNWKVSKSIIDYTGDDKQKIVQADIAHQEYAAVAQWCNEDQQHTIEDDGEYYRVVLLPEPTSEEKAQQVRSVRDMYIRDIEWRISRYNDQATLGILTTDSNEAYINILRYMQYLRDVPQDENFPDVEVKTFNEWVKNGG